jgi:hypothetical protein
LFLLKQSAVVAPQAGAGASGRAHRWVSRSWNIAHPWGSGGVFPNFADPDLASPAESYFGGNLARLRQIKKHYDPGNLFRHAQPLRREPPAGSAPSSRR